jgi:hypothetical protein
MNEIKIIDITPENILEYGVCGYKSLKKEGFPEKVAWLTENYPKGLRIKSILTGKDGIQGMIEYNGRIVLETCRSKRLYVYSLSFCVIQINIQQRIRNSFN